MNNQSMYDDLRVNGKAKMFRYLKVRNIQSLKNSEILQDILSTEAGRDILYSHMWDEFSKMHKYRGVETAKNYGSVIITNWTAALARDGKIKEERTPKLKYSFIEPNTYNLEEW
ncbi:MAG: hypothetical protein J7L15_02290 [Clostridiales bacterium]|nr:hypothetical protein [Clostridiales bacterium]